MMGKIMMDGEPLEAGDKVYCLLRGDGVLIETIDGSFPTVSIEFGESVYHYTPDGKPKLIGKFQQVRTLFWQKPEIIPPPKIKPKKKIKVWDWFVEEYNGDTLKLIGITSPVCDYKTIQKIEGTEREIEVEE